MDNNLTNQKKEEVILAWDKNNPKELEIASGVDEQGNLRKTVAEQGHSLPFIDVNGNSNLFDAFLHNFRQQLMHPKDIIFVKVPLNLLEASWDTISSSISRFIDNINKEMVFDPHSYLQPLSQSTSNTIDINKIDWQDAAQWGITRQSLEKSQSEGDRSLQNLLEGKKTKLVNIIVNTNNSPIITQGRLQLKQTSDGKYIISPILVNQKINYDKPYYGYVCDNQDKVNLDTFHALNKTVELQLDPDNPDKTTTCILGVDHLTKTLEHIPVSSLKLGEPIYEQIPTPEQIQILASGGSVYMDQMKTKNGRPMDAHVRIDAANGSYKLDFTNSKYNLKKNQTQGQQYSQYQGRNNQYGRNNYNQERNSYQNNYKQGKNSYNKKRNF